MKKTLLILLFVSIFNLSSAFGADHPWNSYQWKEVEFADHKKHCEYCDSYGYFTIGTGPILLIPNLGVGYRQRNLHHGFDVSLSASTIIEAHIVQGSLLYHFYSNPYREDPWYVGAGVTTSLFLTNHSDSAGGISPDFVIGKELKREGDNKHFVEVHVQAPLWASSLKDNKMTQINFPLMFIKYGVAF